jgi:hypothetical protein
MTKTTKTPATSDLDPATITYLKILVAQRKRSARTLLKRRRKKSHQ